MQPRPIHACTCPNCTEPGDHPDRTLHAQMNLFFSRLDERQRRWYAGLESRHVGYGGDRFISQVTGMSEKAIRRGRRELEGGLEEQPLDHIRQPGGGRHAVEHDAPGVAPTLARLVEGETAGDPMNARKWPRKTLRKLAAEMKEAGHPISFMTVRRLLKASGYSLHVNARRKEAKANHPDREAQFNHIRQLKDQFLAAGDPVVSVDSKKKGTRRGV